MLYRVHSNGNSPYVWYELLDDFGNALSRVAVTNDRYICPCAALPIMNSLSNPVYVAHVESLVKGKGYATLLLQHVIERLEWFQLVLIAKPLNGTITRDNLVRFYNNLGFQKVESECLWGTVMVRK